MTIYKPFESLDSKKNYIRFLLFTCWFLPLLISIVPLALENEFSQELIISNNIFLTNKKQDRVIKPYYLYDLAKNIEHVWTANYPNSIPSTKSIYKVKDINDWYFNSAEIKNKFPNTTINVKRILAFIVRLRYAYLIFIQSLLQLQDIQFF